MQQSDESPFMIGPDFAHDEVRRYAAARLLLSEQNPAAELLKAEVPRWALGAAKLACQAMLQASDLANLPLPGRFGKLQASFDALVGAGHGARWGDVPGEALVSMSDSSAVLRDAWPDLKAGNAAGLQRLARLVDQRLRDNNGFVNPVSIEQMVWLMLEDREPWRSGEYASNLLKDWLRGHVAAGTPAEHPARIRLQERLVESYAEADLLLEEQLRAQQAFPSEKDSEPAHQIEQTHPDLFVSHLDYGRSPVRERPQVPSVCRDRDYLELLALLGSDLGDEGEAILQRVARDAPSALAPVVEALLAPLALSQYRRGLLAALTESYYLVDEDRWSHFREDGIRRHDPRYSGGMGPLAAWYMGPFTVLFQTDPRGGVAVLNRLLNRAALVRAQTLARLHAMDTGHQDLDISLYENELDIAGAPRIYVGDEQVWYWYRGTGVGPYPCISALQALERICDQFIDQGVPIDKLVMVLLEGCQNLAMVGLTVGILVRHSEIAGKSLDPYLADPSIWHLEFQRVVQEGSIIAANSEGVKAPDRRTWTLGDAAMVMALGADDDRASELRAIGEALVEKARRIVDTDNRRSSGSDGGVIDEELAKVMIWASCLDRDSFKFSEVQDALRVEPTPPQEAVQKLEDDNAARESTAEELRLINRYFYKMSGTYIEAIEADELAADITSARELLLNPSYLGIHHPWDTPALVAAEALNAYLVRGVDVPDDLLAFAADTVIRVAEEEPTQRPYEPKSSYFEQGAERSAARALPLLFMPTAAHLREILDGAGGSRTIERASQAGINLAQSAINEVRLHLARGLDNLWATPCVKEGRCHHELGWQIATTMMRDCALGGWDPSGQERRLLLLGDPLIQSLAETPDDSINPARLDASIRALASAAAANICVSTPGRELLTVLLEAQRRSFLHHDRDNLDWRGTHSLVTARAVLTLARNGDDTAVYEQIDAYADNSALLTHILKTLSAAAEETPDRAATARRIWPDVIRYVLDLNDRGRTPFSGRSYGSLALAALLPNHTYETQYLYRELLGEPIIWWDPLALRPEIEAWLETANGNATCVDQLVSFLRALTPEDQAQLGLPWMAEIVLTRPGNIANRTYLLANWLIETRSAAAAVGLSNTWQQIVDALVVEGDSRLAPYSE